MERPAERAAGQEVCEAEAPSPFAPTADGGCLSCTSERQSAERRGDGRGREGSELCQFIPQSRAIAPLCQTV